MLTIEIHGTDKARAERIRTKIAVVLKGMSYAENYRLIICQNDVIGDWFDSLKHGSPVYSDSWVPFFRVFFDPKDDKDLILQALWPFLIDIYWLVIGGSVLNDRAANPDNYREVAAASNYEDT